MRYTVLWSRLAEQRLAFLWTDAPNRQAVTEAANAIDKVLQTDPDSLGESRPMALVFCSYRRWESFIT